MKVAHCGNVLCNSGNALNSLGVAGTDNSVTVGSDGMPVISYYNDTLTVLNVAHCGNLLCSTGAFTLTIVDTNAFTGRFNAISVGTDGLPVISYFDDTNDDLKVAHCSNVFCLSNHRPR